MSTTRIIAIMGSGETAPTMTKPHRDLFARLASDATGVVLDTPYGFQQNASELAQKAVEYFRQSVGRTFEIAGLARLKDSDLDSYATVDDVAVEQGLNRVRAADYVFAGPGSPTFALQQWKDTPLVEVLAEKIRDGGIVTFSSAAALTLGRFTVPVYEIYKVGVEPHWLEGLDILSSIGLDVAIIPHFDNAEGGHHDTRFCYLGERRLHVMEDLLPDDCHVIGIDEHTGLIIDLDANTASVVGNGTVTVRIKGTSTVHATGTVLPIDALRDSGASSSSTAMPTRIEGNVEPAQQAASLADEVAACQVEFDRALETADADAAIRAILDLEGSIHRWSADTHQNDDVDHARATLRSMIVRLGDVAQSGLQDPRTVVAPFVDALLELRARVRADKRYDLSDLVRDRLVDIGIDVHDTPAGATWELRGA